jgi:SAM-dependent methyltransferase
MSYCLLCGSNHATKDCPQLVILSKGLVLIGAGVYLSTLVGDNMIAKDFNKLWSEQQDVSWLGQIVFKIDRAKILYYLKSLNLFKNILMADIGCGSGGTLRMFRDNGYTCIIGFDNSESAIRLCERNGFIRDKDVFLKDVKDINKTFYFVFTEGSIEHYKDIRPMVKALCGISEKYILTTMPDLGSWKWLFFELGMKLLGRKHAPDYKHSYGEYVKVFNENGFTLIRSGLLTFGWVMLFKRVKP